MSKKVARILVIFLIAVMSLALGFCAKKKEAKSSESAKSKPVAVKKVPKPGSLEDLQRRVEILERMLECCLQNGCKRCRQ
jgi:hypothetical protein